MDNEILESERVRDRETLRGQASASATVQEARRRREPRRSGHRSQDPQSLAEMVSGSAVEDFVTGKTFTDLLDQGRRADRSGVGGDVSTPSEDAARPLSFLAYLGKVSFNADGEATITFESQFGLDEIVRLKDYRNQIIEVFIRRV